MLITNYTENVSKNLASHGLKFIINTREEELKQLAKNSDNFLFIFEFINAYPGFVTAVRMVYSEFSSMDLKFCALLKLGFSTVEIAEITKSSLRAVESRKFRIRKNLKLKSEVDLNSYMTNLGML